MKYLSASALTFLFCLFLSVGFAEGDKKYYCVADQIELTDSRILVNTEEGVFEIDALQSDQGGLFFTEEELRCVNCRRPVRPIDPHRPIDPRRVCECSASPLQVLFTQGSPA